MQAEDGIVGVIGAVPLDLMHPCDREGIVGALREEGWRQVWLYDTFGEFAQAGKVSRNIVVSPSGLRSAKYLKETFGTPYEFHNFGLDLIIDLSAVFIVLRTSLCCNSKSLRNRQS